MSGEREQWKTRQASFGEQMAGCAKVGLLRVGTSGTQERCGCYTGRANLPSGRPTDAGPSRWGASSQGARPTCTRAGHQATATVAVCSPAEVRGCTTCEAARRDACLTGDGAEGRKQMQTNGRSLDTIQNVRNDCSTVGDAVDHVHAPSYAHKSGDLACF